MLEMVMGVVYMEIDKVADEVVDMVVNTEVDKVEDMWLAICDTYGDDARDKFNVNFTGTTMKWHKWRWSRQCSFIFSQYGTEEKNMTLMGNNKQKHTPRSPEQ